MYSSSVCQWNQYHLVSLYFSIETRHCLFMQIDTQHLFYPNHESSVCFYYKTVHSFLMENFCGLWSLHLSLDVRYDPAADTWTVMDNMKRGRSAFALATINGTLTAIAGWDVSTFVISNFIHWMVVLMPPMLKFKRCLFSFPIHNIKIYICKCNWTRIKFHQHKHCRNFSQNCQWLCRSVAIFLRKNK